MQDSFQNSFYRDKRKNGLWDKHVSGRMVDVVPTEASQLITASGGSFINCEVNR
jgi:hypothetical protein